MKTLIVTSTLNVQVIIVFLRPMCVMVSGTVHMDMMRLQITDVAFPDNVPTCSGVKCPKLLFILGKYVMELKIVL